MKEISLTLEFITPAFIGAAENRRVSEFRLPSLKGLLRFWWRAYQDFPDEAELYKNESKIFGDTEQRSKVSIISTSSDRPKLGHLSNLSAPIGYLGYGPIVYDSRTKTFKTSRPCILAGEDVQIRLQIRTGKEEVKRGIYDSLWLLTHLGGLGSRARRGLGSIQCSKIEGQEDELQFLITAKSIGEFKNHLESGFRSIFADTKPSQKKTLPAFSSLGSEAKVYLLNKVFKNNWQEALEGIGEYLRGYRSNRPHQPRTSTAGQDYTLVCGPKGFMATQSLSQAPKRIAFGLPHNYFSSSRKRAGNVPFKADFRWQLNDEEFNRRGSPLIFHVAKLGNGQYCVVITWLRSQFLPSRAKIKAILPEDKGSGFPGKEILVSPPSDNAISDLLGQLEKTGKLVKVSLNI